MLNVLKYFDFKEDGDFIQESAVYKKSETHGGEDVAIYASGPMSHLFTRTVEQNYIFHVMAYSSCKPFPLPLYLSPPHDFEFYFDRLNASVNTQTKSVSENVALREKKSKDHHHPSILLRTTLSPDQYRP